MSRRLGLGLLIGCHVFAATDTAAQVGGLTGPFASDRALARPHGMGSPRLLASQPVTMRDGVRLSTDIFLPSPGPGPYPLILIRTPYDKKAFRPENSRQGSVATFVGHGYAVAVQDVRGRFGSDGSFTPTYRDDVDSYDTMNWAVRQPWSNGAIGTYGCSYLGENQVTAARLRHPAWKAAIPISSGGASAGAGGRHRNFGLWNGGAFELIMGAAWFAEHGRKTPERGDAVPKFDGDPWALVQSLPTGSIMTRDAVPANDWKAFISNPPGSSYWRQFPYLREGDRVSTPSLFINGWYDYGVAETLSQFRYFQRNSGNAGTHHRVVIDPSTHCGQHELSGRTVVGERDVGDARFDYWKLYLAWFDHWLKGKPTGVEGMPPVQYFAMGENRWRSARNWPLPGTEYTSFYLTSVQGAQSRSGDGRLQPSRAVGGLGRDNFTYDPQAPVPSRGGPICCVPARKGKSAEGSFDQSDIEDRKDVLVYSTPPLKAALPVTGPIKVVLYVSSDAPDTDFTAKLIDVYPDGRAFNVQEGIQRMRWRSGYDRPKFLRAGRIYEVEIDLQATSNTFLEGHSIRLEISSSSFPRFDRNLNTGGPNHREVRFRDAINVVHHSEHYWSRLVLPVVH